MTTNLASASYKATGGTTSRLEGDRWSDVVNVKDYGAIGTGSGADDYPAFQLAFDAAFGAAGSPHGSTNAKLNRSVFIPNGSYSFNSGVPTLTNVVGGKIFGAGPGATVLLRSSGPILQMRGLVNCRIENLNLIGGGANSPVIDLDDPSNVGLTGNTFRGLLFSNFLVGILIAQSGNGGSSNYFEQCVFNANGAAGGMGIEARGSGAVNNRAILGGVGGCDIGYYSSGGSIHVEEQSSAGNLFDVRVDSGYPVNIIGGRTESGALSYVTNGLVGIHGFTFAGGATFTGVSISGTSMTWSSMGGVAVRGMLITGSGIADGTRIISPASTTSGPVTISVSQTVGGPVAATGNQLIAQADGGLVIVDSLNVQFGSVTGAAATFTGVMSSNTLTASSVTGTIKVGQVVWDLTTGGVVAPNTIITGLGSGSGGAGTYTINQAQSVSSRAMTSSGKVYLRGNAIGGSAVVTQFHGFPGQNV